MHSGFASGTRLRSLLLLAPLLLPLPGFASDCLSIDEAPKHIGQMACVTGKVLKVGETRSTHYLDFCSDYRRCPFSVVIFKKDIKNPKMLEEFPGHTIRIYGPIQEYRGRPEIVLKLEQQLSGEPGPYADALAPRPKRDRQPPVHPGSGVTPPR